MTQPREHDAVPGDETAGAGPAEPQKPDTGSWYPVDQSPSGEAGPLEPAEPDRPEEVGAESSLPADEEPTRVERPEVAEEPAPVAEERTQAVEDEPVVRTEPVVAGSDVPPADEQETTVAVPDQPPADVREEPTVVVPDQFPADVRDEPTVAVRDEPTVAYRDERDEPTVAVADERTTVLPEAEPSEQEDSRTQRLHLGDQPAPVPGAPADAIFRPASPSPSPSEPTRVEQVSEEEQKLAAERAARREARAAALAAPPPAPLVAPAPVVVHKRTNDKFWGALGLFLLRWVLAAIFAVRGLNILTDLPAAQAMLARTILPEPGILAVVTGVACELIALALLLGLLTRAAGLGIALIAGGALAFVYWGPWSVFVPGQPGFLGEYELLLAAVGVLLLLVGGGGWSLDRAFRAGRERDKRERAAAAGE